MIKSKQFWVAAILLAIIPLIVMDIPKHYMDWSRDVHDEMIYAVQNNYNLTKQQKGEILNSILNSNKTLMAQMYIKGFLGIMLLFLSTYFFTIYGKHFKISIWKSSGLAILLLATTTSLKAYSWYMFNGNENIKLMAKASADTSLISIYNANFKSKVVYVDFWGTTCGPCLEEFRNFTKPLKAKYHNRNDIAYLYICGGHEMVWRQQLQKFDIAGSHLFLNEPAYSQLFRKAIKGSKDTILGMPRYLIMDKQGRIVETAAPRPSDKALITTMLNKYLAAN